MSIRNYKLELVDPSTGDIVAFGPRTIGDYGRDILVVKKALGQLKPFSELIDEEDQEDLYVRYQKEFGITHWSGEQD